MSHNAKVLQFPARSEGIGLRPREAELAGQTFLSIPVERRTEEEHRRFLGSPDILLALCSELKKRRDLSPAAVLKDVVDVYQWISQPGCELGLFDERDYFLGETALIAGGVCRQLGSREEAFLWLDRAEAGFRHTMHPAPGLANVAYARLALRFEMGRYQDVVELTPSLEASFMKLRMSLEAAKCRLLLAMTLKQKGQNTEAIDLLKGLCEAAAVKSDVYLQSRVLSELGDLQQLEGRFELAMRAFQEALALLQGRGVSLARADLKLYVGGVYKALGSLQEATDAFREAQRDYGALEMRALVACTHLVIAETLLEMRRDREAEWEILAALPAIDEMRMVPEGFAAVALLRESVQRRKTDAAALQQVRAQLQSNN